MGSGTSGATAGGSAGESGTADPALRGLVGPGCADYLAAVPSGPGSITGMGTEPLTAALAHDPLLGTFDRAVTGGLNPKVSLTATLGAGNLTVFAPLDSAYAAIPAASLQRLTADTAGWRKALSLLVVRGRLDPAGVQGTHATLAGSPLRVRSTAAGLQVGDAHVVCGGLRTRDATLYLLDAVPLPGGGSAG